MKFFSSSHFSLAFFLALLMLFFSSSLSHPSSSFVLAVDADFDLERVNYPDPVIGVTYNEPVQILDAQTDLTFIPTNTFEGLEFDPDSDESYVDDYELSPSSGALREGEWLLSVTAKTALGITTPVPGTVSFEVTGLKIRLLNPASGFSPTTPYDVTFQTYVLDGGSNEAIPFNAECKYLLGNPTAPYDFNDPSWKVTTRSQPSTDPDQYQGSNVATRHTISNLQSSSSKLSILCKRFKINGDSVPKLANASFQIGTYSVGPNITASVIPPTVFDQNSPQTSLLVTTNQPTYCSISKGSVTVPVTPGTTPGDFEQYDTVHARIIYYDRADGINQIITGTQQQTLTYTIRCTNPAGLFSQKTIDVVVDYETPLNIILVKPQPLTNADPVIVEATTNILASCTLNGQQMAVNGVTHTKTFQTTPSQNYTITINCTAQGRQNSINFTFMTDRVAPTNLLINTSPYLCNGNATAYFNGTDNTYIQRWLWNISDSSGNVLASGTTATGIASHQITNPNVRSITWSAVAEDAAGNTARATAVTSQVYPGSSDQCDPRPFINYDTPPLGFATSPFMPIIETKRTAICGYLTYIPGVDDASQHIPTTTTDGIHHKLGLVTAASTELHILCREADGTNHSKVLSFGVATTPPLITSIFADPNPIANFLDKTTTIHVVTSTPTTCTLARLNTTNFDGEDPNSADTYKTNHTHRLDLSSITSLETQILDYTIICRDRASQRVQKQLPITLQFRGGNIEILSPKEYIKETSPIVAIKTLTPSVCEYRAPDSGITGTYSPLQNNNGIHSAQLQVTLAQGAHTILVRCDDAIGERSFIPISFTVDTIAPTLAINGSSFVCQNESTVLLFSVEDASPSTILLQTGNVTLMNGSFDRYEIESRNQTLGPMVIKATATDAAGNPSQTVSFSINIAQQNDSVCQERPLCGDGVLQTPETCDDGNANNGDGCSAFCQIESNTCGDGVVQVGEDCDGLVIPIDSCSQFDTAFSGTVESCTLDCKADLSSCTQSITGGTDSEDDGGDDFIDPTPTPTNRCFASCAADNYCESSCSTNAACTPDPDCEKKFPWLALFLVILGTILIGGSGYYLYVRYDERTMQKMQKNTPPPPAFSTPQNSMPQTRLSPEERARMLKALQEREMRQKQSSEQHMKERSQERDKVMSAFDTPKNQTNQTNNTAHNTTVQNNTQQHTTQPHQIISKNLNQDSKNMPQQTTTQNTQTPQNTQNIQNAQNTQGAQNSQNSEVDKTKKKTSFDDLDNLIDETK